ncbi:MAG: Uma2 family endonuclease [Prosthecobacter sp.]|uniref:Uma2 family endonuclease n=1 Tax=Prosthecobacter sp. TaxID=1965333 RepID=UPI003BAF9424
MGIAKAKIKHTVEQYYDLEENEVYKSEFHDGDIFAMAGGSPEHSLIVTNLLGELRQRLKGKTCTPYDSNLRIKIPATGFVTYPDAAVFCKKLEFDPKDKRQQTAINPTIVFEVLSKSTESYDRGKKAENYRQLESLKAYVLVSQTSPHIEIYERHGDGFWFLTEAKGLDQELAIKSLGIQLPLAEVYDRMKFGRKNS